MKHVLQMLTDVLGSDANEEETRNYSAEETRTSRSKREETNEGHPSQQGFTVERVERIAKMIDDLPADVPRERAAYIVREALVAAGIELSNFDRSSRDRAAELSSEVELSRNRQKEFREKTEETVHALKEEIRKAREACDAVLTEEEKKVSRATATLEEVKRVRAFFDFPNLRFPQDEQGEETGPFAEDTQRLDGYRLDHQGAGEGSPEYDASPGTVDERRVRPV